MTKLIETFCRSAAGAALALTAVILVTHPAKAEGYGGFQAYLVNMQPNESLAVRRGPSENDEKVGALPGQAEDIQVIWCNTYGGKSWCDVRWKDLRGWVVGDNLQNVEGG